MRAAGRPSNLSVAMRASPCSLRAVARSRKKASRSGVRKTALVLAALAHHREEPLDRPRVSSPAAGWDGELDLARPFQVAQLAAQLVAVLLRESGHVGLPCVRQVDRPA